MNVSSFDLLPFLLLMANRVNYFAKTNELGVDTRPVVAVILGGGLKTMVVLLLILFPASSSSLAFELIYA